MRTVGVEEEFLLLGERGEDGRGVADVLRVASVQDPASDEDADDSSGALVHELKQQQVEANSAPHASMEDLAQDLLAWRRLASSAAERVGLRLVASGTAPEPITPRPVRTPRYDRMSRQFGAIARDQLCCGCHVHVQVASLEEAVAVLDRIRVWLPALVALSANSPFCQGEDTAFASFRTQMWGRWPSAGPLDVLGSAQAYRDLVDSVLATGVVLDQGMLYFDARFSAQYSTVEIRVADVCLRVADAVLIAALCRALVETAAHDWKRGVAAPDVSSTMVALAKWRASRWGMSGALLDPVTWVPRPAAEVIEGLIQAVRPALSEVGDLAIVEEGVHRMLTEGTGADVQRAVFDETSSLDTLLVRLASQTTAERRAVPAGPH